MRISKEELQVFTPKNNQVLCEPILKVDETTIGDVTLYIDTSYRPEFHQRVLMKVISFNKHLVYGHKPQLVTSHHGSKGIPEYLNGKKNPLFDFWEENSVEDYPVDGSMPWQTEMECRTNDLVWIDYVSVFNAEKRERTLECEDKTYYLIPYQDIYCLMSETRGLKVLNGWVLVEPIEYLKNKTDETAEKLGIQIAGKRKREAPEDRYGIVRHIGVPCGEYVNRDQCDTDEISEGDLVLMKFVFNRRLESNYHIKFGDRMLIVTRRPWIAGIIKDSIFTNGQ